MPLGSTYQEVIHMKVSKFRQFERELMRSCVVRYGIIIVHGGADWIASIRLIVGVEW